MRHDDLWDALRRVASQLPKLVSGARYSVALAALAAGTARVAAPAITTDPLAVHFFTIGIGMLAAKLGQVLDRRRVTNRQRELLIDVLSAARLAGVSEGTIRRWVQRGALDPRELGGGLAIDCEQLVALIGARAATGEAPLSSTRQLGDGKRRRKKKSER